MDGLNSEWLPPPDTMILSGQEVHVWRAGLDEPADRVLELQQVLAADELVRADRFYFPKDRDRYIVGRGLLRAILGHYFALDPGELQFQYSEFGKPALIPSNKHEALNFNLSHSHDLALFAFAAGREIGVDLERIRLDMEYEQIAENFFSEQERTALRALPAAQKGEAFFNCWTRKEAYIKARGDGLTFPLDRFDVSLAPDRPARLLEVRGAEMEAVRWKLAALSPGPGFVGAVAVEGADWRLKGWQWSQGWSDRWLSGSSSR